MRKLKFTTLALCGLFLLNSCLGSFNAFNNLKDWNHQVSDNKFVNNLVFWGLTIVPVYPLFFLGDALIFNVIEFWSGSNPIAMAEGESETKVLVKNGNTYEMTATKNKLTVKVIDGKDLGKQIDFNYIPKTQSWEATNQSGETIKLSSFEEGKYLVYLPNGEKIEMDADTSHEEGLALIQSRFFGASTATLSPR